MPDLLQKFLCDLETTTHSTQVWQLIVGLGRDLRLPFVDFFSTSGYTDWKKTLFIRTSYDSRWMQELKLDPDNDRWSYFRSHAMHCLTPITIGLEFVEEYHHIPATRVNLLREAAKRGMRAGFSIPLRQHAPPQSGLLTFAGDHSRREMIAIVKAHGWTLHAAALAGHQRYIYHFAQEFTNRNQITDKQQELLRLIGLGNKDKAIAQKLGISVSAVRQRMNALMQRTGAASRPELAALAMSIGILPDPLHRADDGPFPALIEMDEGGSRTHLWHTGAGLRR
ncbi:helix-turn-helix transcriptional regulator [Primorskyibacter flagellatus]|uniref:Autoinducer binding domain-containing protein n=1 Tax=Primorskyibacter flagellatus TaxID=1387277 RepID=A0A1W2EFQ5_9RHOB|nr:helix-turn-helix transcriptional regulator [Primorskyibacter flagellatus]SMD08594.1 Autoinducer binding domain-containing protein [Primorskyibacter flagellatus]